MAKSNVASTEDIVDAYREGRAAFARAKAALVPATMADYERDIRQAMRDIGRSLEYAMRKHLLENPRVELPDKERPKIEESTDFHGLVNLLVYAQPPVAPGIRDQFHTYRQKRNDAEHSAWIPPFNAVAEATTVVGRFLVEYLGVPEDGRDGEPRTVVDPPETPEETEGDADRGPGSRDNRTLSPQEQITRFIDAGLTRLRGARGGQYDATIESLALEGERLLERDAVVLCLAGMPADHPIPDNDGQGATEAAVEQLLVDPVANASRLRNLGRLLRRRTSLCVEAGWLCRIEGGVGFSDPRVAALLVGRAITRASGERADDLRAAVSRHSSWADAAWAAVADGDAPTAWAALLNDGPSDESVVHRIVAACAAFGGRGAKGAHSEALSIALSSCVLGLQTFRPMPPSRDWGAGTERVNAWSIPSGQWRQCILDLGRATDIATDPDVTTKTSRVTPLMRLLDGLGLAPADDQGATRAIRILCTTRLAVMRGELDASFVDALLRREDRALFGDGFVARWILEVGIPVLDRFEPERGARLLSAVSPGELGGLLLNVPELWPAWQRAWAQRLAAGHHPEALEGWTGLVARLWDHTEHEAMALVDFVIGRLEAAGLVESARQSLRDAIDGGKVNCLTEPEDWVESVGVQLLRFAGLGEEDWSHQVDRLLKGPALAWRRLLQAGAPDSEVARWCVEKLVEREAAPPAARNGAIGMLVTGSMSVLSGGGGQLAFKQAPAALSWLLDRGSAEALAVIADACLGSSERPTRPLLEVGAIAGVPIQIGQVFWSHVVERPEGRHTFYDRVERGLPLGQGHFVGDQPFLVPETHLWTKIGGILAASVQLDPQPASGPSQLFECPPPDVTREAARFIRCFERRLEDHPWLATVNGDPSYALVLLAAAAAGVDVAASLRRLILEVVGMPESIRRRHTPIVGAIVDQLARHHTVAAASFSSAALYAPELLAVMLADETYPFWRVMLRMNGVDETLKGVDALGAADVGLGLFDALTEADPGKTRNRELRAEYFRAVHCRSSQGRYIPAPEFWSVLWSVPHGPEEFPELATLADGPWLGALLRHAPMWPASSRVQFFRHLALEARDSAVRACCLNELVGEKTDGSGGLHA